ncbi:MAG: hypothetical protein ACK4UJ_11710 [Leptonema sp. (in: bacteria)]
MKYLTLAQTTPNYGNLWIPPSTDRTQYKFIEKHTMGISILPEYFQILCNLSNNDFNSFLKYLYFKYHKRILASKIAPQKKTSTASYQPETKNYKNVKLKDINPYLWEKFWDLRRMTGYSISFIIRIFLEWELQEMGRNNEIQNGRPILMPTPEVEINKCVFPLPAFRNNYEKSKVGNGTRNEITITFKDEFF